MKLAKITALQSLNPNRTNEVISSQRKSLYFHNQIVEQFRSLGPQLPNIMHGIQGAIPVGVFNNFAGHQRLEQLCNVQDQVLHPCDLDQRVAYWAAVANNYVGFNGQMCCWDSGILDQRIEELD